MRDKILKWINEDIDGTIHSRNKRKLDNILAGRSDLKKLMDELSVLNQDLGKVAEINPPGGMKQRIMNTIETEPGPAKQKSYRGNRSHNVLKNSAAFALGAAVMLLISLFIFQQRSPSSVWIAPSGEHVGAIGLDKYRTFPVIEKISIETPQVEGSIIVRQMNKIGGLEVVLKGNEKFDVSVAFEPDRLGFDMYKPLGDGTVTLKLGEGYIRLIGGETGEYLLLFGAVRVLPTELHLKIEREGELIYSRSISVWGETNK